MTSQRSVVRPDSATDRSIAVALVWRNGKLLVGKRGPNAPLAGYDEFPGGKCKIGESPEQAVVRECLEETTFAVRVDKLRLRITHDYPHGRLDIHFFDCACVNEDSTTLTPLSPFRWVAVQDLSELRLPEANRELLAELAREIKS